jgi:hypothetical protein
MTISLMTTTMTELNAQPGDRCVGRCRPMSHFGEPHADQNPTAGGQVQRVMSKGPSMTAKTGRGRRRNAARHVRGLQ